MNPSLLISTVISRFIDLQSHAWRDVGHTDTYYTYINNVHINPIITLQRPHIYTVSGKKRPRLFLHNYKKCRHSFINLAWIILRTHFTKSKENLFLILSHHYRAPSSTKWNFRTQFLENFRTISGHFCRFHEAQDTENACFSVLINVIIIRTKANRQFYKHI